jgi:formylglycine-generating enzyme required for sulfatase activity
LAFFGLGAAVWQSIKANEATDKFKIASEKEELAKKAALDSAAVAQQQRQLATDKVFETLQATKSTAEALRKLEITADQAVAIVLPDIDRNIYRLEYDSTYRKCRTAINLNARRQEVEKRVWEIAYFYTEADSSEAAIAFLNLLKPNGLSITAPSIQAQVRTYLAKMIPTDYRDSLEARYYPRAILVAGGSFLGEDSVQAHVDRFYMSEKEVTYWQYNLFARAKKHHIEPPSWEYAGDNPATYVKWYDAAFYLNWLSDRRGKTHVYTLTPTDEDNFTVEIDSKANGYRLPTEAEWEFAARGGNKWQGFDYSGSKDLSEVGWYSDNSNSRTHPVGQKKANELGMYDMSGNVWEWCQDLYELGGSYRVLRGGSWYYTAEFCRSAFRLSSFPVRRSNHIGFRLVFVP